MNKISCEVCGSVELTKNGDLFICDYCGCKYTIDDIRKQIVNNNYNNTINNNINNLHAENLYMMGEKDFNIAGGKLIKYQGENMDVIVPDNVIEIGTSAFSGLPIRSVKLPISLITIGEDAFGGCKNLTNIELTPNIKEIGRFAFSNCSNLDSIIFPSSLEKIEIGVINETRIKNVFIPQNVQTMEYGAFQGTDLNELCVDNCSNVVSLSPFYHCKINNLKFMNPVIDINVDDRLPGAYQTYITKLMFMPGSNVKEIIRKLIVQRPFTWQIQEIMIGEQSVYDFLKIDVSIESSYMSYGKQQNGKPNFQLIRDAIVKVTFDGEVLLDESFAISEGTVHYGRGTPRLEEIVKKKIEECIMTNEAEVELRKNNRMCILCGTKFPMFSSATVKCKKCGKFKGY